MRNSRFLFHLAIFSGILWFFSCSGRKYGPPVEPPAKIMTNFMSFWYYWNDNVKLSLDYTAYDEKGSPINEETFLKALSSENYLALRMEPDTGYIYKLYRISDTDGHYPSDAVAEIARTIGFCSKVHYRYWQLEGKPLPGFHFTDLNGDLYDPETCKGKIVVLNTWFIGCHTCRREMPALNALVDSFKNRKDVLFVSLALDHADKLKAFFKTTTFEYATVPGMRAYIWDTLKVTGFPTQFIVNRKGILVHVVSDYHQMETMLGKMIREGS